MATPDVTTLAPESIEEDVSMSISHLNKTARVGVKQM